MSKKRNRPSAAPMWDPNGEVGPWGVPTSVCIAEGRVARYARRKPWKGGPMCSEMARKS